MDIAPSHEKKNSNILKHVISRIFIYPLDIATHSWYNSLQGLRFTTPRDKNTSHHITQYISFTYMYIYLCKKKLSNIREVLPEFQTYKHSKSFVTFTMKENLNRLSSMYSVQKIFFLWFAFGQHPLLCSVCHDPSMLLATAPITNSWKEGKFCIQDGLLVGWLTCINPITVHINRFWKIWHLLKNL